MSLVVNAGDSPDIEPRKGLWQTCKSWYGKTLWLERDSKAALCIKSIAYPALAAGTGLLCYYVASYNCDLIGREYKDLTEDTEFDNGTKIGLTVLAVSTVVLDLIRPRAYKKSAVLFFGAAVGGMVAIHKKVSQAENELQSWGDEVQYIKQNTKGLYWQDCLRRTKTEASLFTNPNCSVCLTSLWQIDDTFITQLWTNPNFNETICQDPNHNGALNWGKWPSNLVVNYTPGPMNNPTNCDPEQTVWGTSVSWAEREDYFLFLNIRYGYVAPMNVNITPPFWNGYSLCVTMIGKMTLQFPIWSWCMDGASQLPMPPRKPYTMEMPCATEYFRTYFNEYKLNTTNMAFFFPVRPPQAEALTESDLKKYYMYVGVSISILAGGVFIVSCYKRPSFCVEPTRDERRKLLP